LKVNGGIIAGPMLKNLRYLILIFPGEKNILGIR
jgi:hypothetical protein